MNLNKAKKLAEHITYLAELAATFNATYGANYWMTTESPAHAWSLYRKIMSEQANIASLLNVEALRNPGRSRPGEWWKRQDVPDSGVINELAQDIFNLIGRCAYLQTQEQHSEWENTALCLERSIAGILHPSTRILELDRPAV